jgi:murein DD-endopeptidase
MPTSKRIRAGASFVFGAAAVPTSLAAQVQPRQARVEVSIPKSPAPVMADGKRLLGYELHVTNFDPHPLHLRSVEVFSSLAAARPIVSLKDSLLRAAVQVGPVMQMAAMSANHGASDDAPRIAPGERAIIFLWLTLSPTERAPALLRHRLTFGVIESTGKASEASAVIDGLVATADHDNILILGTPMRGGDWLAGGGPSNSSDHRRSIVPLNGKLWISQRFATDWVKIGPNGNTWHGDRSRNENFWGFGEPVLAVADAEVVTVSDSIPDNIPGKLPAAPTVTNIAGNHVILRVGPSRYVMYGHLKYGSVRVHAGEHVKRGDTIALLGNSGQATGPHLHFQVMDAASDLAAEGTPFVFDRFTFIGFGRNYEPDKPHLSISKQRELPVDDAVVHFPGDGKP